MKVPVLGLIGKEHPIRILNTLRTLGPMRFSEIQKATGLNPAQVDRSLKQLRKGLWVVPETQAAQEGPIMIQYHLGKRGEGLLDALDTFRQAVHKQRSSIGDDAVEEIEAIFQTE
jgi:DNA-binding HxlR family transcriptional regulator